MAWLKSLLFVFFISSCALVTADDSEEEEAAALAQNLGNPFAQTRGDNVQVDPEDLEEPEEPEEVEEPEEPEEVEEPEEPEEVEEPEEPEEVEEPEEPEEVEESEVPEAGEFEEPDPQEQPESESSVFFSASVGMQSMSEGQSVGVLQQQGVGGVAAGGDSSAEQAGGAMINPNLGGAQVAPGEADNSEEVAMVGGAAIGGVGAESESNEIDSEAGGSIGNMGSSFTLASQFTTGPPLVMDTTTMQSTARTPEPIRGDNVMGMAAAETNEAALAPAPQTMSKQKVAGLAAGLGAAGVVGVGAVGLGLAFKAGLIGGGGSGAAAGGGAAATV